jgi:RNA polymerase sigma-70 factor (ECF subfamily)
MNDQQIWSKITANDVGALRVLHDKYYHLLWLCARKITLCDSIAEEIVSDCFLKLWEVRGVLTIEKSVKAYLLLMVRNQAVSHLRKARPEVSTENERLPELLEEYDFADEEFYSDLYKAIAKIPDQRRKILELAAFESLSYKEIAARLNISVNTVKTQMGRAYQFLKDELDPKNFVLFSLLNYRIS